MAYAYSEPKETPWGFPQTIVEECLQVTYGDMEKLKLRNNRLQGIIDAIANECGRSRYLLKGKGIKAGMPVIGQMSVIQWLEQTIGDAANIEGYALEPKDTISVDHGNEWSVVCPTCGLRTMHVVGPGKVRCWKCG